MSNDTDLQRSVPGSATSFIFAVAACPLAFMGHLVSLAVVLATLAIALGAWVRWKSGRSPGRYSTRSIRSGVWGLRIGLVSLPLAIIMWALWATSVLPLLP